MNIYRTGHNGTVKYTFMPTIDVNGEDENWFETLRSNMQKVIDDEFNNNHCSR